MKSWNFDSTTGDVSSDGTVLCKVYGATTYNRSINATKCMRTARLIAAAPEMYNMLEYLLGYVREWEAISTGTQYKAKVSEDIREAEALLARIDRKETEHE